MDELYLVTVTGAAHDGTDFVMVAASVEAAVNELKRRFKKPYKVKWGDLTGTSNSVEKWTQYVIEAEFDEVPHYSVEYTARFEIRPLKVVG